MAGKNLKVALEITADLNQARREVGNFREDIIKTSKAADAATSSQEKLSQSANQTANQIQKMSKSTDMKTGVSELKNYEKQLDQTADASTRVAQANGVIEKSVKTLAPHFLALTAASGGFVALAVDTLNKAVDLQNLSNLSGMDVEQFQYYAAGAKTVSIQTEKLGDIFKDTRDKVGDFIATGGGELKDFFENVAPKVGVTAEQFKKLGGADALQLFFNTLKQANVSDNEMVFYLESIADEASALIPLLNNNGAEFKKLGDQAKASGAILDQEVVNNAKEAKAALGALQNEIAGVTNQLVANAAPAITFLAENLDALAQAGLIVASVYVARLAPSIIDSTKATIAELTAKGQSLFMSKARATALLAEATSAQAKTAADLRAAQTALAVASGSNAQAIAQARLTAARAADTAAILAQSRAQSVLDTTVSKSKIAAGALLGTLGGPVGLAITAAGVAASFLMMRDGSNSAIEGFDIQKTSADELIEKYKELNSESKQTYLFKLTEQLEDNEKAIKNAAEAMDQFLLQKMNSIVGLTPEARKAILGYFNDLKAGGDQAKSAFEKLKNTELLKQNELAKIAELGQSFITASSESEKTRQKIDILNGSSQSLSTSTTSAANASNNLTDQLGSTANAASKTAGEVINLSKAYKELQQNTLNNTLNNLFQIDQIKKGTDPALAALKANAVDRLNADPNSNQTYFRLPDELDRAITTDYNTTKEREELEKKITDNLERRKKIAEQTLSINKRVLEQAEKYNYAGLEDKYGLPSGLLSAISMQESRGNPNARSPAGALGAFQFMPETAARFGLKDRTDVAASAKAAAQYFSILLKMFEGNLDKAIMAYNAGEGNVSSGKAYRFKETQNYLPSVKRYLAGANGLNDENAQANLTKIEQARTEEEKREKAKLDNQIALQEKYYPEDLKMLIEHQKNREAILKAGFDREKEMELLLAEDKRFMAEKNKSRLEMLKDVQTELISLDQNYLKANGQVAQAELDAIDEKYKELKTKIETLLQSSIDPVEKLKLQDAQLKLSVVIDKEKATAELNQVFDEFDKLQSLREQRQSTAKLQYESGQTSQFQYAEQLRTIDSEMKPALQNLIDQAAILAENMGDAFSISKVEAMAASLNIVDNSFRKFLPTVDQIQERIAGGMTDAILDWADGTKSASDAFRQFASDFLREIAQMILKQMIFNAVKAASSAFGFAEGGFTGFASGGYTGAGGKYDPAGIVHKGEVVWSQEDIKAWGGVGVVESMRKHRGYADGGIVAAPSLQVPTMQMPVIQAPQLNDNAAQIAQSTSFNANQNFYLVDDPKRILDTLNSSQGQENIVVMMSRDPSKFKAALKIGG
ncbi:transglycosylase SLT domain-containing protein [Acinetobacter junii]|uniref:transglycosylase SLT domain-containing protein n=1 Tax=Acinetobacter junii TaxID=40215 RepID=UPI00100E40BE|nr:transglycosylase SLT domain-containing protein [Acinetobacter junii]RXS99033.1 hypothetical protein ETZ13_04445 [Acinetobacter junii]